MAITYPVAMPTSGVTSISWSNMTSSLVSRSPFSFQGQAQSYGGAIRQATISVENLNRDTAEDWLGFLDSLNGTMGTFLFGDPSGVTPRGAASGFPAVQTRARLANQTGSSIQFNTSASQANVTNWLVRGDWIQIGTGVNARLYKVTQNASTNSSGQGTLEVWPSLRISPTLNQQLIVFNTVGLFRRSSGSYNYIEDNGCKYGISFDIEEVI